MEIIAVCNQKGGVGKTTSTLNLAIALKNKGMRVACLDFDPQCHLAKYQDYSPDGDPTIHDYIFARATYKDAPSPGTAIRHLSNGLDLIPGSLKLAKFDVYSSMAMFRERLLEDTLRDIIPQDTYDYLFIDCNPSMGMLMTNALVAATSVLIPVQTEDFAADGLDDMLELIAIVQRQLNPKLHILGFLPTMVANNGESAFVLDYLREHHGDMTFHTEIRRSVDAPRSNRKRFALVGSKSNLGKQYEAAADEILQRKNREG